MYFCCNATAKFSMLFIIFTLVFIKHPNKEKEMVSHISHSLQSTLRYIKIFPINITIC